MIVCLAANPSVDKLFEIERLVLGAIHRPEGFVQVAGGKGLTGKSGVVVSPGSGQGTVATPKPANPTPPGKQ